MAYEGNLQTVPGAIASADISANQFEFVNDSATGYEANVTAGGVCDGVLQDKPTAIGQACSVAYSGVSKVYAGATVAKGALVQSDATSRAITAIAGDYHCGRALSGGAVGEIISVLLDVRGTVAV